MPSVDSFKNSVYPKDSSEAKSLSEFEFSDEVYRTFEKLLEPRIHVFNFSVIKSIEIELSEHPEYQSSLINHLSGKGPVSDYFGYLALDSNGRLNALSVYQSFIDAVKNTTDQQQKAFSTFLKEYTSMIQSSKTTFEEVMTTDMTREKCWSIWRNQSISQKAIEMVKLVNLLDKEFGIKTCLANVIELKNTVKLSKYWNQHPALGNLSTLFPIDKNFSLYLKTMLTNTEDLTRKSTQKMLKILRPNVHTHPKFVGFFETIQQLHGINLEPVWMMIKQFLEFSDENKKNYIEMNFEDVSLRNLGDFFKTIQKVPTFAKEFEETFIKPNEQWNKEQMEKLLELLKVLQKSKYSDEVDHALDDDLPHKDCLNIVQSGANVELFEKLNNMATSFDLNTFSLSNFQNWTEIDSSLLFNGVDEAFEDLLDSRLLDFDFKVIETIENNLMENPDFETSLMGQLENEQVNNYFARIDNKYRAHVLFDYTSFFIPMVKSYTKSQLDAVMKLLREYPSFKNSTKVSFGNVLTRNATRYECWDLWKIQALSSEMEGMVTLVKMFGKEFDIETCFSKVIDIRDIVQLSEYWNGISALRSGKLNALFPMIEKHKKLLKIMLDETQTPSDGSYRSLITVLRYVWPTVSDAFYLFIQNVQSVHGSNYEPLWIPMNQFLEYSEDTKRMYIEMHFADNNSSLVQFLKTIPSTFADDFDVSVLKPSDQWTPKQMSGILEFVRKAFLFGDMFWDNEGLFHLVLRVLDSTVLTKFQNWTEIDSSILFNGIDETFKDLLDPRFLDFNFTLIQTIEYNLMEHPDFETSLMSQMENKQVKNYFTRIDKTYRAHVLFNYTSFFIPIVKSYTKSQLNGVSELFKEYPSFKNSNKVSFGNVLTRNATRYECWDLWKSQKVSTEIEKMVKLVKVFEKEFGIKTCFSKVIDIRDIAQLSEFWNDISDSKQDYLTSMVPVNETFVEILQTILTDTKTPSRSSYRHILKTVRGVMKDHTEPFKDFIRDIWMIHGSDYEPFWTAMKQFFEYSEDQRKEYIDLHFADSNSSLAQFLKMVHPTFVDDLDVSVLKPYDQWDWKQMRGIYDVVWEIYWMQDELANEENQPTIEMVERVLEENVSYKECEDAWNFMKDDDFAKKMRKVIGYLDDSFGKMSCETEPPRN
ncbi:hypothetical protein CAEBREN_09632 [Caenorhabditis brenneri]|uniref:Uncharacterized protein n=1 Tax=Caenorhabditis brenneri TaxID=135651 RepID=G0N2E2_CAEBE|nr:hypothetical protein CAEBREN_09632 [Caenorhabditis brenneri]